MIDYSIIGKRFGMLTVIDSDHIDKNNNTYWLCRCDCGREKVDNKYDWSQIDTFGEVKSQNINNFNYEVADKIYKYLIIEENNTANTNNVLEGLNFVITGSVHNWKNRDELKSFIEAKGGKVLGSVSKNTSYLINNDIESNSGKNKKAKELDIPIISEENFLKKFDLL